MQTESEKPYQNALIFSGGSSLSGYYLGMYEALCELEKQPDVILASCGGTLMAGLISLFPTPELAKKMLLSNEFYQMICRVKSKPPKTKTLQLSSVLHRYVGTVNHNLKTSLYSNLPHSLPHRLPDSFTINIAKSFPSNFASNITNSISGHIPLKFNNNLNSNLLDNVIDNIVNTVNIVNSKITHRLNDTGITSFSTMRVNNFKANFLTKLPNATEFMTKLLVSYEQKLTLNASHHKVLLPHSLLKELDDKALFCIDKESANNTLWQSKKLTRSLKRDLLSKHQQQDASLSQSQKQSLVALKKFKKPDVIIIASRTTTPVVAKKNLSEKLASNLSTLQSIATESSLAPLAPLFEQKYEKIENNAKGFLWQQVLCCNNYETVNKINHLVHTASVSSYSKHIMNDLQITSKIPLAWAIRASINDMFYLSPVHFNPLSSAVRAKNSLFRNKNTDTTNTSTEITDCYLFGGIIDLLPIEIASKIATNLYVECKNPLDNLIGEPAIQSVFGFSANQRRLDTRAFSSENNTTHWIDTTDNDEKILPMFDRKYNIFGGCVDVTHHSYETFVSIVEAQYQYGYDKVMQTVFDEVISDK